MGVVPAQANRGPLHTAQLDAGTVRMKRPGHLTGPATW